jgi:hypothetical protein
MIKMMTVRGTMRSIKRIMIMMIKMTMVMVVTGSDKDNYR